MLRSLLVFAILALSSSTASADFYDGNKLRQLLDSNNAIDTGIFWGYVAGLADLSYGVTICPDQNVRLSQSAAVVKKYLAENPQAWNLPASTLVLSALKGAFPCKK